MKRVPQKAQDEECVHSARIMPSFVRYTAHMIRRSSAVLLVSCALLLAGYASVVFAETDLETCTKQGMRLATPDDAVVKNGQIKAGTCYDPKDASIGATQEESKQYLRSIVCRGSQFGGTTPDETVEKLDAKFAVCAAKFLKAMSSQLQGTVPLYNGGSNAVCLREGFRTVAQQEKYAQEYRNGGGLACTKGAGCEHPRGIAIDVNAASEAAYQTMWNVGPQYGVNFYLKQRDKVHFIPTGGDCSAGGVTPTGVDYPQYYSSPSISGSTNPFATAFQRSFTQASQPLIPSYSSTPAPTPVSTLPQPAQSNFCLPEYQCQGNTLMYKNSFCAVQAIQQCSAGCVSGACIAATSTPATSTIDIIGSLGGVTATSTAVGTSTPLSLILAITQGEKASTTKLTQPTVSLLGPGSLPSQQLTGQQTFTSSDLSGSAPSTFSNPQTSGVAKILADLKGALQWALSFLTQRKAETQLQQNSTIID